MSFYKHTLKQLLLCAVASFAANVTLANDSDLDGVLDIHDLCPDTEVGQAVYEGTSLQLDLAIDWQAPVMFGSITDPNWSGLGGTNDSWQVTLDFGVAETTLEAHDNFVMSVTSSTVFVPGTEPATGHEGTFEDNYLVRFGGEVQTMPRNLLRGKVDHFPGWGWTLMRSLNNFLPSGDAQVLDLITVLSNVGATVQVTELFSKARIAEHSKAGLGTITAVQLRGAGCALTTPEVFQISSVYSSRVVDVSNISLENGASIHQWEYVAGANQQWYLDATEVQNIYQIRSVHSNKCIDIDGPATWNGANIHQWACHNGDSQRWEIRENTNGEFELVNVFSGKCLDVQDWHPSNGGNIQQWSCGGNTNQLWNLIPVQP